MAMGLYEKQSYYLNNLLFAYYVDYVINSFCLIFIKYIINNYII